MSVFSPFPVPLSNVYSIESAGSRCPHGSLRERVREEERREIARELHDELGQHMTALRLGLSLVQMQFGRDNPALAGHVDRLVGLTDTAIHSVRTLATSLHTSLLRSGLRPALEGLRGTFEEQTGTRCLLSCSRDLLDIDAVRTGAIFRIVQESLTNVARHAAATRVTITLKSLDGDYILEVCDNGVGFDLKSVGHGSLGLTGMRERSLTLGGPVIIFSHPGQGTTVQAFIPRQKQAFEGYA
ncbi:MAG TPA: sensor histidine kinase [Pseudomonas sp.]|nr:sensor histidine kinase [Pseudomonas sp.]